MFKKGDEQDPGNYRRITFLSVVGKVFCKVVKNRLVQFWIVVVNSKKGKQEFMLEGVV